MANVSKSEYDKEYYAKNRETIIAKRKARREQVGPRKITDEEREKRRLLSSEYYYANRESALLERKAYYQANKEAIKSKTREYAKANPEQTKAYLKAWIAANPDRYTEQRQSRSHVRRVRLYGGEYEKFTYAEIFERDNWICGICSEPINKELKWPDVKSVSLDHIIPVSKGGSHIRTNVQAAHLGCNIRKGANGSA
jgi:5-methylcytosine-specific restriction endonuclease McrA